MNPIHSPSPRGGLHRIVRLLSLLVIHHALGPVVSDGLARTRLPTNQGGNHSIEGESRPYLRIAGALPLRFRTESPPPDLAGKPAAGAPPHPALSTAFVEPISHPAQIGPASAQASQPIDPPAKTSPTPAITTPTTISILPDDTRPSTRPEDFLPFFQFPGGNGNMTVAVPVTGRQPAAPNPQPPSSATYQQR